MNQVFGLAVATVILAGAATTSGTALAADSTPSSAQEVRPLLIGAQAPSATVQSLAGDDVALKDILAKQRSVLVFYRGGW